MSDNIYSIPVKDIKRNETTLAPYKNKVLLMVNVASKCGFTPQYTGLEGLYRKYKERGFEILGFPCNQFGSQEPGDEEEIQNFCKMNYDVSFPLYAKVNVNGEETAPIYDFLKSSQPGFLGTEVIKWNFTKFLVDRSGQVIARFAPNTKPEDLEKEIEKLL